MFSAVLFDCLNLSEFGAVVWIIAGGLVAGSRGLGSLEHVQETVPNNTITNT